MLPLQFETGGVIDLFNDTPSLLSHSTSRHRPSPRPTPRFSRVRGLDLSQSGCEDGTL